jgi:ABC-2 type transport system permease protein
MNHDPSEKRPSEAQVRWLKLEQTPFVEIAVTPQGLRGAFQSLKDVFAHRELLNLLIRRDLKSKYKDSTLGVFWTLLKPLTQLVIFYVVIGKFLGAERGIPNFAIYVFAGLTAYSFFSEIVLGGTSSILNNSGLIKKVALPREVFPIASVGSAGINFAVQLSLLIAGSLLLGAFPPLSNMVYFLPALSLLLVYGIAFSLLFSALNVTLRDIQYLVEVGLMVLMWASPIVYSWQMAQTFLGSGLWFEIYLANPLTQVVIGFQAAFWNGDLTTLTPDFYWERLVITLAVGVVGLILAQRVFSRLQGDFAQAL